MWITLCNIELIIWCTFKLLLLEPNLHEWHIKDKCEQVITKGTLSVLENVKIFAGYESMIYETSFPMILNFWRYGKRRRFLLIYYIILYFTSYFAQYLNISLDDIRYLLLWLVTNYHICTIYLPKIHSPCTPWQVWQIWLKELYHIILSWKDAHFDGSGWVEGG